jgi:hypothetical protein
MRAYVGLAGIMLAAGCGKQLNPEYCLHHNTDSECSDAGLVFLDAAPPCTDDSMCTADPMRPVCDTGRGECVPCTPNDHALCTGETSRCTTTNECVGCTDNTECASGLCLAVGTCAALDRILYVTPNGPDTSDTQNCRVSNLPCTLQKALTLARTDPTSPGDVIHMEAGDYAQGPYTLDIPNLTIVVAPGQMVTITDATNGPVFNITAGPVEIDDVTVYAAKNDDAIKCTNATLTLSHVTVRDNPKDGIHSTGCTISIMRGTYSNNHESAMYFDDTNITVWNNFVLGNGNSNLTDGIISLQGHTGGSIRFNTLASNHAHAKMGQFDQDFSAGVQCQNDHGTTNRDGLYTDNTPVSFATDYHFACGASFTNQNWVGTASDVQYQSSTDLHLTDNTPDKTFGQNPSKPAIRDNANTTGTGISVDIDGDARQINGACDYGADEYKGGGGGD